MRIDKRGSAATWKLIGALSSFTGAVLAGFSGCVLTTSWLPGGSGHPWLYQLGTVLLIITIPLLICGGHCLDLLEGEAKKERDCDYKS
jgi:hypothetical protein